MAIRPQYPELVRNRPDEFRFASNVVSVDFEFDPAYPLFPTEMAVCAGLEPHTTLYGPRGRQLLAKLHNDYDAVWIGHNSLTTEKKILESELKTTIPLERVEDTMVLHYCANAHLCKGAAKDEDSEDPRGQGFMDLWSMASLYTNLPQWKRCRGQHCTGPCPVHDHLGYNGVDAYAVDVSYPVLKEDLKAKNVFPAIVEHVKKLMLVCDKMQARGIKVDRDLVRQLEREMDERKAKLFTSKMVQAFGKPTKKFPDGKPLKNLVEQWDSPFNPRSPQQVMDWFSDQGVKLDDTSKEEIQKRLDHLAEGHPAYEWLEKLYEYKAEGKGLRPWFDDRYFSADGLMHPRFNPVGTSTGRLASSNPNFQNIPRVGFGKRVRRVVVPRDPSLILTKADKSQLELRMVLWYAGVLDALPWNEDAFTWLLKNANGLFEKVAEEDTKGWTARDYAKRSSHALDYGEGLKVYYGNDLSSSYIKGQIENGSLTIYRDWEYHGGVVGFTGINMADAFWGSATHENRRKANEIAKAYFGRFDKIRGWQKKVSRDAERGYVNSASGRYLQLNGKPEDKLKIALAFYGQGGGADDVQEAMLRYDKMGIVPLIQVHDELVNEFPRDVTDKQLLDFYSVMSEESKFMPGFRCPVKVSRGENWLDMTEVGKA